LRFEAFFAGIHGRPPFPWQSRFASMVEAGSWPEAIHLPTSAGKTSVIDVWLWARSKGWAHVPRRMYYLIDRRSLVDAAAEYARNSIAKTGIDASVVRLRGGTAVTEEEWMLDPSRPALISTTVDQLGSRLLGRAYGVGRYSAAIHAGLAGNDALIVIDEAHLVEPLRQTMDRIGVLRTVADSPLQLPWQLITMTATPLAGKAVLALNDEDKAHPLLSARFGARKLTTLQVAGERTASVFVDMAVQLRTGGAQVVGVVVNRVALAREIHAELTARGEAMLLIGRARPFERDALGAKLLQRCGTQTRSGSREPLFVVATQTIEVGLDLDLDALVSELAPVSALRQRFGRLDRLGTVGTTHAAIVSTAGAVLPYSGASLDAALKWLKAGIANVKGVGKVVDMGVNAVASMAPAPAEGAKRAPYLLPQDLGLLFDADLGIEVEPYLHGEVRKADISIAWRKSLDDMPPEEWPDAVERQLPLTQELMPLTVRAAAGWLAGRIVDASDLETEPEDTEEESKPAYRRRAEREQPALVPPFVIWDGEAARLSTRAADLKPGMTVVLPASSGGYDAFGWAPTCTDPVRDLLADGLVVPQRWRGDNTRTSHAVPLAQHLQGVGQVAARFATGAGLPPALIEALDEAGRLHDLGKNDSRFQLLLGARPGELLAKSGAIDPRITREFAGLPIGWRHEVASVAARPHVDPLVRYLIGSHHGRGKPWLPARPDVDLWREAQGAEWPTLHRDMVHRFGWWGLAYLEALLRLADWARSVEEQAAASEALRRAA
jgi:CRISPR-associated endonuclease/helicase Cas3